jgi:uncharacterized membrane protein (UPF0127 family)
MNLARWISWSILKLAPNHRPQPVERLQVFNLTRQTVLATCVEVASKGATRRRGLLGRERLAPGEGLWIIPCEAIHTFGMRFPIDLVYLDRKKLVKKVKTNVAPGRLSGCFSAFSTIELPAGTVLDTQTKPGDRLEFSPLGPRPLAKRDPQ